MELYKETGKLKSGEIRIARPIGALLIKTDRPLGEMANETITVYVERANGSNEQIATNQNLKRFILASVFGNSAIETSAGVSALCEICENGAIQLEENEGIKISLNGLSSTHEYQVNGIEYPQLSDEIVRFDTKKVLSEEASRKFNVQGYESVVIEGITAIDEAHVTYENGQTVKYNREELVAISFDVDPLIGVGSIHQEGIETGMLVTAVADTVIFPLVGVTDIDIYKGTGAVTLTLKDESFQGDF